MLTGNGKPAMRVNVHRTVTRLVLSVLVGACPVAHGAAQSLANGRGHTASSDTDDRRFTRTIEYDTDEGTYMCVDVSPDGRTLVFDLLGDLYTLLIGGGRAEPLVSGRDWVKCPRYSPDGKTVAFISDRGKTNNLWVLDLRSRTLRQLTDLPVTPETGIGVNGTPSWHPNGREIAYLVGDGVNQQIAAVPLAGGAARLLTAQADEVSSPAFAPDGRALITSAIFTADVRQALKSGSQPPNHQLYRLSLDSGAVTPVTPVESYRTALSHSGLGGDLKPVLSKSGRYLAYIHSNEPSIGELRVRDLRSGADRRLLTLPDVAGAWLVPRMSEDNYPGYAITPDEQDVVIWSRGKLYRVAIADGATRMIPFTVHVTRDVAQPIRGKSRMPDGDLPVRAIRWPTRTPDGKTLIFSAVGSLWRMALPDGKPERLTQSEDFELMPAVSPDGQQVAYIVCARAGTTIEPGRLMIRRLATGETRAATVPADTGTYWLPSWSPDGQKIAVLRDGPWGTDAHYGWIDLPAGQFHPVAPVLGLAAGPPRYVEPHHVIFSHDGSQLIYVDTHADPTQLVGMKFKLTLRSVRLDGSGARELLTTSDTDADITGIFPSPDLSRAVVLGWDYEAYLTTLPPAGAPARRVSVYDLKKKAELTQISRGGALYPRWLDARTLLYGWTTALFQHQVGEVGSRRLGRVALTVPRRGNRAVYAWRNARLITLSGAQGTGRVIERGTLVVRGRRIAAVGPVDSIAIPPEAAVVDAEGLTIMPGLIDAHAHYVPTTTGAGIPIGDAPVWSSALSMAYGFTTAWDAAVWRQDDTPLAAMELLEAGRLPSPDIRWFGGSMVNFMEGHAPRISSMPFRDAEEVRQQVRRRVELGSEQCVKDKNAGQYRQVMQWIAEAAREAGVCAVAHVQNPTHLLSRVADGYQVDHPSLWAPSYRDVVEFLARTGAVWTLHSYMNSSGMSHPKFGDGWLELASMFERLGPNKERELRIQGFRPDWVGLPPEDIAPLQSGISRRLASLATELVAAGAKVAGASTDGGGVLDNHFELWAFRQAGMPPGDVLRTATMFPAEKLGLEADIGSLEVGKLADLLVLEGNPLERIENTLKIKYTVLAGLIYQREPLQAVSPSTLASPSISQQPK